MAPTLSEGAARKPRVAPARRSRSHLLCSSTCRYDAVVTFANGTVQQFSTFERPHLVFDEASGRPTHLVSAVQPYWMGPRGPCDGCSARPGSEHSCVVCKTTPGLDYTYTLVSKLNAHPEK